jgi:CopA family copper-resistance protein
MIIVKRVLSLRSFLFVLSILGVNNSFAADRTVNLNVAYKTVNFTGKSAKAIAINNQIPGPILHFKDGDHVTINVYNHLDKGTAIHWHGLLVPWRMDGVEGVSQHPIPPGGVFHYVFTLKQSGTYWYHAHAGLQEQQGLYGAIIIDPIHPAPYKYTKDYAVVLSDWSNTAPEQIYANLKKDGDFYSSRFPLQPSLVRFIQDYRKATPDERKNIIDDYKMMQQMRMSIYDISDVAYDAFLLNGHSNAHPWTAPVKEGDVVRLRFINAGASTIFNVKIPHTTMKMVQVDGNDVKPYTLNNFSIAPAETYDILIKIQKNSPYIIYAESADTSGKAYGALLTEPKQHVGYQYVTPFPIPEPSSRQMMAGMMSGMEEGSHSHSMTMNAQTSMPMDADSSQMKMGSMSNNDKMSSMSMPDSMKMDAGMKMDNSMPMNHSTTMSALKTSLEPTAKGTKYQNLISLAKTNNPDKPVEVIKMVLSGYMGRYIWFINGVPGDEAKPILIEPGKRYRLVFINDSMMHHPMHLHGHFMILRNGHGAYDPLLHTIDVPPGATIVADFDADTSGQWFFHCHFLYHMMAGMSRVFQYTSLLHHPNSTNIVRNESLSSDNVLAEHPMAHSAGIYRASFLNLGFDPTDNIDKITFKTLFGSDYNKLELYSEEAEINKGTIKNADLDIFYWHLISEFWAIKGGANYVYRPVAPYWQPGIGIEGLMPYFIDTNVRVYYHDGGTKLDVELSRDTQITNSFFVKLGIRSILSTKTVASAEVGNGLNQMRYTITPYIRINPNLSFFTEYEHEDSYGALRNILHRSGEATSENTVTLGISLLL